MKKHCKHLDVYQGSANAVVAPVIKANQASIPFFEIRGNMNGIKYPCLVDIKYDGILVNVQFVAGKRIQLTTKEGKEFQLDVATVFKGAPPPSATFLAEWISGDGKNGTLFDLMRNRVLPGMPGASIKIFDVLTINENTVSGFDLIDRRKTIADLIKPEYQVDSVVLENSVEVAAHFKAMEAQDYEGVVVKNLNETLATQSWVKVKRQDVVALKVTKVENTRFEVDHGGVTVGIRKIWPVNVGDVVNIRHNGIQKSGSLRNPVPIK
jgi:ATP-dependent DNA ligase